MSICGYFLTVDNRHYGRCYVKENIYHCVLSLNFTLNWRQIQQDRFKMLFTSVQKHHIFDECRHFSAYGALLKRGINHTLLSSAQNPRPHRG